MPENAVDLLSKAIAARIGSRQHSTIKAEDSHSYSMSCPACKASIQFSDDDLDQYRTDDETSETSDDDDENTGNDDDDEEEDPEDRASALAARLVKAAKKQVD